MPTPNHFPHPQTAFVNCRISVPAGVDVVLADAPPEEAFAAIAAGSAVVLAGGAVPADGTQRAHPKAAGAAEAGCF